MATALATTQSNSDTKTGTRTLLVVCDDMTPDQEAAALEYVDDVDILTVRSPELALSGTRLPAKIRRQLVPGQRLVVVVHDGCRHLASHYTIKVKDSGSKRRESKPPSAQEITRRRNNHLWIGIQSLKYAIRHARRTRDQELVVTTLLITGTNQVMEFVPRRSGLAC